MNVAFSQHRLWQLWYKNEPIPARPPRWPAPIKAYFYFENEKREPEVHEVWTAPIVNGKPELKAWTYDVKACNVKIRELLLVGVEIQEGWPSEGVQALAVPTPAPTKAAEPEPEAAPVRCPLCGLAMPPIAWQGNLCFPPHNDATDDDCSASYHPVSAVMHPDFAPRGRFSGFGKLMEVVPQTHGEALPLYPFLESIPGHEWDNRSTTENAAWLIRELILLAFPVDPKLPKKKRKKGR